MEFSRFLRDVLKLEEPEKEKEKCSWELLNKVIHAMYNTLPFQCLTLMAKPLEERHRPTDDEIKSAMFQGLGGLCYTLNLFTYHLLKYLGYDVHLNTSLVPDATTTTDNHLVVLLKNLRKDGDIHLVDAGCGHPTFQAISLDFETESPMFQESFLRYKFVKHGCKIRRLHDPASNPLIPGNMCSEAKSDDYFELFYEFEIKPTADIDDVKPYMDIVYTDPDYTPFHKSLRAMKYKNDRLILICNSKLALETENGEITVTTIGSDEELEKAYRTYFPEFDEFTVRNAIRNWRQV